MHLVSAWFTDAASPGRCFIRQGTPTPGSNFLLPGAPFPGSELERCPGRTRRLSASNRAYRASGSQQDPVARALPHGWPTKVTSLTGVSGLIAPCGRRAAFQPGIHAGADCAARNRMRRRAGRAPGGGARTAQPGHRRGQPSVRTTHPVRITAGRQSAAPYCGDLSLVGTSRLRVPCGQPARHSHSQNGRPDRRGGAAL